MHMQSALRQASIVAAVDMLVFSDGTRMPITTKVTAESQNLTLQVADAKHNALARARQEAARRIRQRLEAFKRPGKMERLKYALIARLPVHPQYLRKGTI